MIEFGKTLRDAREKSGLSVAQIADATHMLASIITDLENEDFSKIAAPIYGRGFVRLYAETVGLDPKPLIQEFMEIYNGNREPTIRERKSTAEPAQANPIKPQQEMTEPVEAAPESAVAPAADFQLESETIAAETVPPPQPAEIPIPPADPHALSRYASPLRDHALPTIPTHIWRSGILLIVALALLFVIGVGVRALYRATETRHNATTRVERQAASVAPQPTKAVKGGPRTPQKVNDLYLD